MTDEHSETVGIERSLPTVEQPALFDGDTGDMTADARMAAIALKREPENPGGRLAGQPR